MMKIFSGMNRMRKSAILAKIIVVALVFALMWVVVPVGVAAVKTYGGVDFPLEDISFADWVVEFNPGTGTVSPYTDPKKAIGPPDCPDGEVHVALGHGGILTLLFRDNYLIDVEGADLYVFEIGPRVEWFRVEISKDGSNWIDLGTVKGQPTSLDIHNKVATGDKFSYVRITDAKSHMSGSPVAGADIDAVGAIGAEEKEKPPRSINPPEKLEEFLRSQGYDESACPKEGDPPPGSVKFWSLVPGGGIKHSSVMLSYDRQIEMGHKRKPRGKESEYISEILPPWQKPKPLKGNYSLQKTLCPPPTYHVDNDCVENMKGIDREYHGGPKEWNCHGFSARVVHNCVETGIRMKPITDFEWKGKTLILNGGEVWGDVIPLTIQIPQGAVQFGSEYTIEVRNDNTTIIYLIKGKADYKGTGHSLSLSSGQMAVIDPTGVPSAPTTFDVHEMDLWWTELNYEGKGSSAPTPKPLEIVKLFTGKSVYPRGEKVDVHYHIKNTGTVDVDEYHVEYDIIDATGKTVYKNVGGAHSISAGDENKWHSEKWEIPSNAEYGPCTIEARLKWDSETDTETTDCFVTQATRAKDKTAELEITELYTSKFEYSRGEAIELCYRIKNVGTTDAEYHLCNIIEVEGEKGYWFIFSTRSIAAGGEQKRCTAGCWKIPSDAKCGTYTIETTLVWDSKTVKKETTFIVK